MVDILRCPRCSETVIASAQGLACPNGHRMPTAHGYIDVGTTEADEDTARTFRSFGYEWTTFSEPQPEEEVFWEQCFQDVPLDELRGKLGLDAGCGRGRFSRFTAPHLGWLVALDGSQAVEAATRSLAHLDNVVVVKADLRDPPFAPESFGFVSCLGVLHHLADPEAGLRALTRLLAPTGCCCCISTAVRIGPESARPPSPLRPRCAG